jgi:hypothetical protein
MLGSLGLRVDELVNNVPFPNWLELDSVRQIDELCGIRGRLWRGTNRSSSADSLVRNVECPRLINTSNYPCDHNLSISQGKGLGGRQGLSDLVENKQPPISGQTVEKVSSVISMQMLGVIHLAYSRYPAPGPGVTAPGLSPSLSSKGQRAAAMGDLGWEASTANTDSGALTLLGAKQFDAEAG